jgi:hypothetical protein
MHNGDGDLEGKSEVGGDGREINKSELGNTLIGKDSGIVSDWRADSFEDIEEDER